MATPDGDTARRTNRSSAQVRQGLLDAAARLVRERGVAAVTYRDIAAEAGASDSVLLRHFGSKNELISEAVIEPFTTALEQLVVTRRRDLAGPPGRDPLPVRRVFLVELHEILAGNRSLVRALLAAEASGVEDPVLVPALRRLREVLGALSEAGEEPELTARLLTAMSVAVAALDDVLFPPPAGLPPRDALVNALAALTMYGRAGSG